MPSVTLHSCSISKELSWCSQIFIHNILFVSCHSGITSLDRLVIRISGNKGASIKGYRQSEAVALNEVHHRSGLRLGIHQTL